MPKYKQTDPDYMAYGPNGRTAGIHKSIKCAAEDYFKRYPGDTKCSVSIGERMGATDMFIAKMNSHSIEITVDMLTP